MMRSMKLPVQTGIGRMRGGTGTVISWRSDRGSVRYYAEIWQARGEHGEYLPPGAEVEIVAVDRLELVVAPHVRP
jgi:membrane-bound ClpP family serine protease